MANENNKFLSFSGLETLVNQIYNIFLTKSNAISTYVTKNDFDQFKGNIDDIVNVDTSNLATKQELKDVEDQVKTNKSDISNCLTKTDAGNTYASKKESVKYYNMSETLLINQLSGEPLYIYDSYDEVTSFKFMNVYNIIINNYNDQEMVGVTNGANGNTLGIYTLRIVNGDSEETAPVKECWEARRTIFINSKTSVKLYVCEEKRILFYTILAKYN